MPEGSKVIHFVRHGEGAHNRLAAQIGKKAYKDPRVFDPPLTDTGRAQAARLQDFFQRTRIDAVLVSPLRRTLSTAAIACEKAKVPFIVVENLREQHGVHICDQRRHSSIAQRDADLNGFDVDFKTHLAADRDCLYQRSVRESKANLAARGYTLMAEICNGKFGGGDDNDDNDDMACYAVFTHSSFLMTLFNGVFACEEPLKRWFETGECRSVIISASLDHAYIAEQRRNRQIMAASFASFCALSWMIKIY